MLLPDEEKKLLHASLHSYADELKNKGVREILNSDFKPPREGELQGRAKEFAANWKRAMSEWRQRYGSLNGWNEFNSYWKYGSQSIAWKTAFEGSSWQKVRDNFGYASKDFIYSHNIDQIAGSQVAANARQSGEGG